MKLIVSNALKNSLYERVILDKLTVAQLVKKFFVFAGTLKDRHVVIIVHYLTFI